MSSKIAKCLIGFLLLLWIFGSSGCGKSANEPVNTRDTTIRPPLPRSDKCLLVGIDQINGASKPELSLVAKYDNSDHLISVVAFDSVTGKQLKQVNFTYVTSDSVVIDMYQFVKLDANGRVVLYKTLDDLSNPSQADVYKYSYEYNADGFLVKKNFFLNNDTIPNYTTRYTYQSGLLTSCEMISQSIGNIKIMASELKYDLDIDTKNTINVFPDAFEMEFFFGFLNFGKKQSKLMSSLTTTIYDPGSGAVLDRWVTLYDNPKYYANGYIQSVKASGDSQLGLPWIFGTTRFSYTCK